MIRSVWGAAALAAASFGRVQTAPIHARDVSSGKHVYQHI